MRLLRASGFVLVCLLGCTSSQKPPGEVAKTAPSEEGRATPCDDDNDCVLSCSEPGDCCGEPPFCKQARHWDDHNAIQATRTNCSNFDWSSCPQAHFVEDEVAIPVCKRKRCKVKIIPREPPPAPIDTSGFDRSCTTVEDCTLVQSQPCAKCGCAGDPINAKELDRFNEAMAAVKCPPYDPWPNMVCGSCAEPTVRCEAGRCEAG
jgi:hypothetical protein